MKRIFTAAIITTLFFSCTKKNEFIAVNNSSLQSATAASFYFVSLQADNQTGSVVYYQVSINPTFKIKFSKAVDTTSASTKIQLKFGSLKVGINYSYTNNNTIVILQPKKSLYYISKYTISIDSSLKSFDNQSLGVSYNYNQITTIDSTDKFPRISDDDLLNLIEQTTFNYFWNASNTVSGMAKERLTSETCTTGGTGFGIMTIPVAIERNFITREEGLSRLTTLVNFLDQKVQKYHGAFPHWVNGSTGATIPFSPHDDGADLVETAYLMEGLLTARMYFNGTDSSETKLRSTIIKLYRQVDWNWFTNGQNTLYWHWSPNYGWDTYQQVNGWNEALITYVMAAGSPTHTITLSVYKNGWARNGAMKNGNTYYGVVLPLGPANGGPLFFEHYSFMGINPNGLKDNYADYQKQTLAHTQINYNYCVANPKRYNGYSDSCWGLTASDDNLYGYLAHEPNNDDGVLTPTAALSSFPYTPAQSMAALQFFYYKLGDKLWNSNYGFKDAFNLSNPWFDSDYLAIDQLPIVVMIENYRTQLIWNLFMNSPEAQKGLKKLKFTSTYF